MSIQDKAAAALLVAQRIRASLAQSGIETQTSTLPPPPDHLSSLTPAQRAAQAAARVQTTIIAHGVAVPNVASATASVMQTAAVELLSDEIVINNSVNRAQLTSRSTHDHVFRTTGANVVVRGRYVTTPLLPSVGASTVAPFDRPLHLKVAAPTAPQLARAIGMLRAMDASPELPPPVSQFPHRTPLAMPQQQLLLPFAYPTPVLPTSVPTPHWMDSPFISRPPTSGGIMMRVLVGIGATASVHFNALASLLGPRGDFLRHIELASKASLHLLGAGTKFDLDAPLHILIVGPHSHSVEAARSLVESLIETVIGEYVAFSRSALGYATPAPNFEAAGPYLVPRFAVALSSQLPLTPRLEQHLHVHNSSAVAVDALDERRLDRRTRNRSRSPLIGADVNRCRDGDEYDPFADESFGAHSAHGVGVAVAAAAASKDHTDQCTVVSEPPLISLPPVPATRRQPPLRQQSQREAAIIAQRVANAAAIERARQRVADAAKLVVVETTPKSSGLAPKPFWAAPD